MSFPSTGRPVDEVYPSSSTVSGVPVLPIYSPPLQLEYDSQHQFPPPLSYVQYTHGRPKSEPSYPQPPPPSLYYSRYPASQQLPASYGRPHYYTPSPVVTSMRDPVQPTDENVGRVYTLEFDSEAVRSHFSGRVMSLLFLQFLISALASAVFMERKQFRENIVEPNAWVLWFAVVAGLMVLLLGRSQSMQGSRSKYEVYLFTVWSVALVSCLTWTTALLESKFVLIVQMLLAVEMGSLLLVGAANSGPFLTGRSLIFTGISILVSSILISALYTKDASVVFFALFLSLMAMIYFVFRLHHLMGDENRKLSPEEIMSGALAVFL